MFDGRAAAISTLLLLVPGVLGVLFVPDRGWGQGAQASVGVRVTVSGHLRVDAPHDPGYSSILPEGMWMASAGAVRESGAPTRFRVEGSVGVILRAEVPEALRSRSGQRLPVSFRCGREGGPPGARDATCRFSWALPSAEPAGSVNTTLVEVERLPGGIGGSAPPGLYSGTIRIIVAGPY